MQGTIDEHFAHLDSAGGRHDHRHCQRLNVLHRGDCLAHPHARALQLQAAGGFVPAQHSRRINRGKLMLCQERLMLRLMLCVKATSD